jgi:ABC-type sugar transport system ATPase subunit
LRKTVDSSLFKETGITIVIVTHDRQISRKVDRVVAIRDGRTSSEFVRTKSYSQALMEMGNGAFRDDEEEIHEELSVIDRTGRIQIPREYIEALNLKGRNKVKVELDEKRIILRCPEDDHSM